jgi:hypothetical protein
VPTQRSAYAFALGAWTALLHLGEGHPQQVAKWRRRQPRGLQEVLKAINRGCRRRHSGALWRMPKAVIARCNSALPEREMAGWWWRGPDSKSDCCCSMDAFELEVSGSATGREAADGLA